MGRNQAGTVNDLELKSSRQQRGELAEDLACKYLQSRGLRLIERNFQCKLGEIDLIMWDSDQMVFIEVRYRDAIDHRPALESVTPRKQHKIVLTTSYYLQKKRRYETVSSRFDVVTLHQLDEPVNIKWIKNAFILPDGR